MLVTLDHLVETPAFVSFFFTFCLLINMFFRNGSVKCPNFEQDYASARTQVGAREDQQDKPKYSWRRSRHTF
jgi:hypothetical protein